MSGFEETFCALTRGGGITLIEAARHVMRIKDFFMTIYAVILEACPAKGSRQARESFFVQALCSKWKKIPPE